jgi:hypothetical protein
MRLPRVIHATVDDEARELPSGLMVKHSLCGLEVPARQTITPYSDFGPDRWTLTPCWVGVTCDECKATHIDHTIGTV